MNLPKTSTIKSFKHYSNTNSIDATNVLNRNFNITYPNLIWVRNITYIKVNGNFFYICIIVYLFSKKSSLINVLLLCLQTLLSLALQKLLLKEINLKTWFFIQIMVLSIPLNNLEMF